MFNNRRIFFGAFLTNILYFLLSTSYFLLRCPLSRFLKNPLGSSCLISQNRVK